MHDKLSKFCVRRCSPPPTRRSTPWRGVLVCRSTLCCRTPVPSARSAHSPGVLPPSADPAVTGALLTSRLCTRQSIPAEALHCTALGLALCWRRLIRGHRARTLFTEHVHYNPVSTSASVLRHDGPASGAGAAIRRAGGPRGGNRGGPVGWAAGQAAGHAAAFKDPHRAALDVRLPTHIDLSYHWHFYSAASF